MTTEDGIEITISGTMEHGYFHLTWQKPLPPEPPSVDLQKKLQEMMDRAELKKIRAGKLEPCRLDPAHGSCFRSRLCIRCWDKAREQETEREDIKRYRERRVRSEKPAATVEPDHEQRPAQLP